MIRGWTNYLSPGPGFPARAPLGIGGKGGGIIEGEVVEEMRKNEGQGAQDRNTAGGLSCIAW